MIENNDFAEIRKWLAVENNLVSVQNLICTNRAVCSKVLDLLSDERIAAFSSKHKMVVEQIKDEPLKYERIIRDLANSSTNKKLQEIFSKLLPLLDKDKNILEYIKLPTPPVKNLTQRRIAQLQNNYKFNVSENVIHVNNNVGKIVEQLASMANECSFCDSEKQAMDILDNLSQIIYPNMGAIESNACIKMLDHIFGIMQLHKKNSSDDAKLCEKYVATINTCVLSFMASHENHREEYLYNTATHLYTHGLAYLADNFNILGIKNENLVLQKTNDDEFSDVSNEIQKSVAQNLDDLF